MLRARSVEEAEGLLARYEIPVVLYDGDTPGVEWKRAISLLARAHGQPCVVLLSRTRNGHLWEQVTAAGGYDVLRKPLDDEAVSRAVRSGTSHWQNLRALEAARRRLR
jgi:AmiR/NasT family two-component response regulator